MRFGPVQLRSGLEGAILAHTLRLGNGGGAVKKGAVLTAADIERLRRAGYQEVTVAQLEPGDVHEDKAAERLAATLAHPSVSASAASTGRCNLHASHDGLFCVDRERIDVCNRISESITIATLPPYSPVPARAMVATIKIIPFAVPEEELNEWEAVLASAPALRVAPFSTFKAGLVLTSLPGMKQSLLERASRAQRARLRSLGSTIRREVRCEHSVDAVARAIGTLRDEGCNPILLLGASAIVDRGDVIPAALRRTGGEVAHLGMPVDPGNLMMLGSLDETTVFGLPGCARSLNPSGFDDVLRRFAAGNTVDSDLIGSLGVGGLLKEIPDRPMPRKLASQRRSKKNVAGVVLAAGQSRRMGAINKLTMPVDGVPMVTRVVDALQQSQVGRVVVVTGHQPDEIREALAGRDVVFVHNANYEDGMGSSVGVGVSTLKNDVDGAVIALGDMPWVSVEVIDKLVDAFSPDGEVTIYVPMFGRKRGNPVLWSAQHFAELSTLSGDVGGKQLFHRHPHAICYVDVESATVNIDVDTPEALDELGIRSEPE